MFYITLNSVVLEVFVLVGAAFFTLMERSGLGYIHNRKGPNKVGYMGLFQPFGDAIKLFSSEIIYPYMGNYNYYFICPVMGLLMSLFIWMIVPYSENLYIFNFGVLFILSCLGLGVYFLIFAGWSSNSKYSLLGCLRAVAQMVSYEVGLMIILLGGVLMISSLNLILFFEYQKLFWFIFILFPIIMMWFIMSLAETNRSPFDLAEGESELVSGFNVEYMGGSFSLIMLSEYSSIMFMSLMIIILGMSSSLFSLIFYLKLVFIGYIFIWIRGSLPRMRYDNLMEFSWKIVLPISLNFMMYYSGLIIFLDKMVVWKILSKESY
uniref:NADH-ubiquinone oxidoreductase chain 1 n=1 Tax=Eosembia sp. FS-2017 TaxID=2021303 RepID=A0A678PDQ2_9NEOP|nr:NADH dehydrogenase subunit 1 [Eosembia sp. FS-2017]